MKKEHTILVTGASRGIGKAIALKFASKGWRTVINCRKQTKLLQQVKKEIEENYSVPCLAIAGDMGNYEFVSGMFQKIHETYGDIDVLINNAGISEIGLITDLSIQQWDELLSTNLSSVFYSCKLAIPGMIKQHSGHIINISSVWGITGASCEAAYSASKGGVNAMTCALAKELAPSGICVNAIACGAIDTEMNYFLSDEERLNLIHDIPADRLGRPEEVADLAYGMVSHNHGYLTGQVIRLDGGWI